MNNLQFIHTSPGYIGEFSNTPLSLNSYFFTKFWTDKLYLGSESILFPQRVPRLGFFTELKQFEFNHFKSKFDFRKKELIELLIMKPCSNRILEVNILNALIRLGDFEFVISHIGKSESAELQYLKEIAKVNLALSLGNKPLGKSLLDLFEKITNDESQNTDLKLKVANRFIVSAIRYKTSDVNFESIPLVGNWLIEKLNIYKPHDFKSNVLKSMCHRGVSMLASTEAKFAWHHLEESMKYALNATPETDYDEIVKKENLLNLHQSFSKAYAFTKDMDKTESHLKAMLEIDTYDSVVQLEIGLFYFNNNKYDLALKHFIRAFELGPPSLGMNAFFVGKCNLELNKFDEAIEAFQTSTTFDEEAVSPLLELFQIYKISNDTSNMISVAKQLLDTPCLREQLELDEITEFKNLIDTQL
jgi:tetratricopeptide (TPR) repeat protein